MTFYALVQEDGRIRSCCDAQAISVRVWNNDHGDLQLPPAIGETFSRASVLIESNKKIETQISNHILNPNGGSGKYTVSSRGKHAVTVDFLTLTYTVRKVMDGLCKPVIAIGESAVLQQMPDKEMSAGLYTSEKPLLLNTGLDGISATTSPFNADDVAVRMYYKILPEGAANTEEREVEMVTEFRNNQLLAQWKSPSLNITDGLADGRYTFVYRYEAESLGEHFVLDNEGKGYAVTFEVRHDVDDSLLLESMDLSAGSLVPVFDPNVFYYTLTVGQSTAAVEITAFADNEQSTVEGAGRRELSIGKNLLEVKVKNDAGDEAVYTLVVTRLERELTSAPLVSAPRPTYSMDSVMSFFSSAYPHQTEMSLTLNWGQEATAEFVTIQEDTNVLKLQNLGWFPLGLNKQRGFLDENPYMHVDVYAPETSKLCIGYQYYGHAGTTEAREIYGPTFTVPAGKWFSIDIPVQMYFDQGYNRGTVNVLRFKGEAKEIYVSNMYTFKGRPKNLYVPRKPDTDATLKSLSISQGELTPAFNPEHMSYRVEVPHTVATIVVEAEATSEYATVNGTGEKELFSGENILLVAVTAESGDSKIYKLTIDRAEEANGNGAVAGNEPRIVVEDGIIRIVFDGEEEIRVYTVGGLLVDSRQVSGTYEQKTASGVYIIRIGDKAYKVLVE